MQLLLFVYHKYAKDWNKIYVKHYKILSTVSLFYRHQDQLPFVSCFSCWWWFVVNINQIEWNYGIATIKFDFGAAIYRYKIKRNFQCHFVLFILRIMERLNNCVGVNTVWCMYLYWSINKFDSLLIEQKHFLH